LQWLFISEKKLAARRETLIGEVAPAASGGSIHSGTQAMFGH